MSQDRARMDRSRFLILGPIAWSLFRGRRG
jgi:hypothetical protein